MTKERFQKAIIERLYSGKVLNNSHRGDLVEVMVLEALGPGWKHVGVGWNLWDIERGSGAERVRIQVKHCAALQLWGKTKELMFQCRWSKGPAEIYLKDANPGEREGWFCELFVVGLHLIDDPSTCDHLNVDQWQFMVVPTRELAAKQSSMRLSIAMKRWPPVSWNELSREVEKKAFINHTSLAG